MDNSERQVDALQFGQIGTRAKPDHLSFVVVQLQVGTIYIQPSSVVRDLGVYMDSELTMKEHVAKIAAACFYHIRRLARFVIGSARKSHSSWSWRS